jgi:hypothetical protein
MKKLQMVGLFGAGVVAGALIIGLWLGGTGRQHTMTHDALIQQAIGQLAQNKVGQDKLEMPQVRDAAVVCFKIKPDSNVQMVLDSHTGEKISASFRPLSQPFLKEYMSN